MKIEFKVYIEGSGPTVEKAYQDMQRKLLPIKGWADTDEAIDKTGPDTEFEYVPEGAVMAARIAFKHSKDGLRVCNGGATCLHDVVVYGIPACMMNAKELKKMNKRGKRITKGMDKSS